MAINLEQLRAMPEVPPRLPSYATDVELIDHVRAPLGNIAKKVSRRFRIDRADPQSLFHIDGSEDESRIRLNQFDHRVVRRVQHDRMQEFGIIAMEMFGFNEDSQLRSLRYVRGDGMRIETARYPSTTIGDLTFIREVQYIDSTNEPIYVRWSAIDSGSSRWLDFLR